MEETVKELLEEIPSDDLHGIIDYSKRTGAFKFKKPELKDLSKSLSNKLKDLKTTPSVFRGQRLRVRKGKIFCYTVKSFFLSRSSSFLKQCCLLKQFRDFMILDASIRSG